MNKFFKKIIFNFLISLNLNIQRLDDFDKNIFLINKESCHINKRKLINNLIKKYPKHWLPYYKKLTFYHYENLYKFLKYINVFNDKNLSFFKNNSLNFSFEIIDSSVFLGSIGNYYALETLIKANLLNLRSKKKLIVLINKNNDLNNTFLFKCFSKHFKIIYSDHEDYLIYKNIEKKIYTPLGLIISINNKFIQMDIASNIIENILLKKNKSFNILSITQNEKQKGYKILSNNNFNTNKWIVTLHIREPSFRGENFSNTKENFRTSNPRDYINACKEIVKSGGLVFRMGDNTMSKFPIIEGVIDYAHSKFKSNFMDIFLASQSRFCIGTASGYFRIPRYFGVPVLFTNSASYIPLYSLKNRDIFLPRMLKKQSTNKYLSFKECLSPEISLLWHDDQYKKKGILTIQNTKKELLEATKEMIALTDNNTVLKKSRLQLKFDKIANSKANLYCNNKIRNLSSISKYFINEYAKYLDE